MTEAQSDMLEAVKKHGLVTVPLMALFLKESRHKVRGLLERLTQNGYLIKETDTENRTNHPIAFYRLKS